MELKQLEYFVAAAEELNFTRAAKRCHVVQSAISASIKALEAELATELFDRTTHRVRLTDDGETLHGRARDVLRSADIARSSLSQGDALRGRLAIGVMQGAWQGMPQAIGLMKSRHPEVRIRLRQAPVTELFREVLESRLDVAVVPLGRADVAGLQSQELYREDFVLLRSAGTTGDLSQAVTLAELADEEFVVFSADWALQAAIDHGFDRAGISPSRSYEVNDITVGIDIVRAGLAIMIVPRHLAPQLPGVDTVELAEPIGWRVGAISSARMCSPAASAFTDIVAASSGS
jgi:DNA-binding transcriptional LysR family regulator